MAQATRGIALQEAGMAAFGRHVCAVGFWPDATDPHMFRNEQESSGSWLGYGVAFISDQLLSKPVRWQAQVGLGWIFPDVDSVKQAVDGDTARSLPTVFENPEGTREDYFRYNYERPAEFRSPDNMNRYFARQAELIDSSWQWWATGFASLDSSLEYLKQWLLGQWPNWDTGYILALLHDRPDEAVEFVRLHLCRITFHENEQRFAELMDRFRAFADAAGKPAPALPAYRELDYQDLKARYDPRVGR